MNLIWLGRLGRMVFALAMMSLAIENWICARMASGTVGPRYSVIPVLPFLPAIPWLAYAFGAIWAACSAGLLFRHTVRTAALALGGMLFFCAVILEVPKYAAEPGDIALRTVVFEPLALATLAWLVPGFGAIPDWLGRASRYLLALSLIVFGYDHFPPPRLSPR